MKPKIRVLVVDDSAVVRKLISEVLMAEPDIEVVGTAVDPFVARDKLIKYKPDVMTLDIEMPRMDGISFLKKVMLSFPTRTLIVSSLSGHSSDMTRQALEAGAIAVFDKSGGSDNRSSFKVITDEIVSSVRAVANAQFRHSQRKLNIEKTSVSALSQTTDQLIGIASSTGGTEALKNFLPYLPVDAPGILVVQHMPPGFTKSFAKQLDSLCKMKVKEAEDGERILSGLVLLAPGDFHMEVERSGGQYLARLNQREAVHGVRPSADYLFCSIASQVGPNAIGVILTGMGKDGTKGLIEMHKNGSINYAQDEQSSVVFGMPKFAIESGAIHHVVSIEKLSVEINREIERRSQGKRTAAI